jgi:hypothetical protein
MKREGCLFEPQIRGRAGVLIALCLFGLLAHPRDAAADESGVSFWQPGTYDSLAAIPNNPGWSFSVIPYHDTTRAGAAVSAARFLRISVLSPAQVGNVVANSKTFDNYATISAGYTVPLAALGGAQAAFSLSSSVGRSSTSESITILRAGRRDLDAPVNVAGAVTGFGDMTPQLALYWPGDVHNFMLYGTGNIPVGLYNKRQLTSLGIGHAAVDGGAGYTYLNNDTGYEASAVLGVTYNLANPTTLYKSGVDLHVDLAASKYLTDQLFVGPVGYFYREIGCDSGEGAKLGCFRSRVAGAGAGAGYSFPVGNLQAYVNLKAYGEFAARNRPAGWNAWLTFTLSQ